MIMINYFGWMLQTIFQGENITNSVHLHHSFAKKMMLTDFLKLTFDNDVIRILKRIIFELSPA